MKTIKMIRNELTKFSSAFIFLGMCCFSIDSLISYLLSFLFCCFVSIVNTGSLPGLIAELLFLPMRIVLMKLKHSFFVLIEKIEKDCELYVLTDERTDFSNETIKMDYFNDGGEVQFALGAKQRCPSDFDYALKIFALIFKKPHQRCLQI